MSGFAFSTSERRAQQKGERRLAISARIAEARHMPRPGVHVLFAGGETTAILLSSRELLRCYSEESHPCNYHISFCRFFPMLIWQKFEMMPVNPAIFNERRLEKRNQPLTVNTTTTACETSGCSKLRNVGEIDNDGDSFFD